MFSDKEWQDILEQCERENAAWARWERRALRFILVLISFGVVARLLLEVMLWFGAIS